MIAKKCKTMQLEQRRILADEGEIGEKITIEVPDDLLFDGILLNLPWKSVVRWMCVSKQWHCFIGSHRFVGDYLNYNIQKNLSPASSLLIRRARSVACIIDAENLEAYRKLWTNSPVRPVTMLGFDSIKRAEEHHGLGEISSEKELIFPSNRDPFVISCCCDGIICVTLCDRLLLWNPETGDCKTLSLPDPDHIFPCHTWKAFGFGYDSSLGDYKVVKVPSPTFHAHGSSVENFAVYVMTLKTNLWRKICNNLPYYVDEFEQAVTSPADQKIYWIAQVPEMDHKIALLGFDVTNEKFREVPMPPNVDLDGKNIKQFKLGLIGGFISLVTSDQLNNGFIIWILMGEKWIEFARFPLNIYPGPGITRKLKPLLFIRDDALVMEMEASFSSCGRANRFAFLIYDLKTATCKKFQVRNEKDDKPYRNDVYVHTPRALNLFS